MSADTEGQTDAGTEEVEQTPEELAVDALVDEARREISIEQRLRDAEEFPLYGAPFDPDEAEELGFFIEEALTPEEAESAMLDHDRLRDHMVAVARPKLKMPEINYEIEDEKALSVEEVQEVFKDLIAWNPEEETTNQ